MAKPVTVVTINKRKGRDSVDSEILVDSLEELYTTCRDARPSHVIRISLRGPEGEVRLNFGSFIRKT
jgi:hypothetical protein